MPANITVVHVVESFASGTFGFLSDLISGMPECECIVIHGRREETPNDFARYFPEGMRFITWRHAGRELSITKDFQALLELFHILRKVDRIDVIHLHSSKAGFLGRIVARLLGLQDKALFTPHGAAFLRKDVSALKHRLFVWFEKIGAISAGKVVACSKSEAEAFTELGIDATYVNNSVTLDIEEFLPIKQSDQLTIVTSGRISYQKNPALFNDIALGYKDDKRISFLWIGDGELRHELAAPNITVTGWIRKDEALAYLAQADIYLSTSLWEGLPISVLEAMGLEKPLVLSDCVGNRDLVTDNGFICRCDADYSMTIDTLTGDHGKRKAMGRRSKKLYQEKFSLEQMIAGYAQLYKTIAKSAKEKR